MNNSSFMRTWLGVVLSCLLAGLQAWVSVSVSWSALENQSEASFPEDTEESETDASVTVIELSGRRVARRRSAERIFQKQGATAAAQGVAARSSSRLPIDQKAVAETFRPMRC